MHTDRMIVFSNPLAGKEHEYLSWYVDHHLFDMMTVPGVLGGQFFSAVDTGEGARWRHMGLFDIEHGAQDGILAELARRRASPATAHPDLIDQPSTNILFGEAIGPWVGVAGAAEEQQIEALSRIVSLGSPLPGREADFDRYYSERHIPDVLDIPGFVGARRYALTSARGHSPWQHAAIYAARSVDPLPLHRELLRRRQMGQVPSTDASDKQVKMGLLFAAASPYRTPREQAAAVS